MQNRTPVFVFCIALVCLGIFAFYRSSLKKSDLKVIEGKVTMQTIRSLPSKGNNHRNALAFEVDNHNELIGFFLGPHEKLNSTTTFNLSDSNKAYKFYLDPTVISANGINLGIKRIESDNNVIFEESSSYYFWIGISLFSLATLFLFIALKYGKKKNAS